MSIYILHDTLAAPDGNTTRLYQAGETYEVGSEYMPEWLADALCKGGYRYPDKNFVAPKHEAITHVPMKEAPAAVLKQ